MTKHWYYEYAGKKIGPVPAATLKHLASHGAVTPITNVWAGEQSDPVPASRIKNLFPQDLTATNLVHGSGENATVRAYLQEALDACRDEDDDRLKSHIPKIFAIHPFSIRAILLDFKILGITLLPLPTPELSLPHEQQTKPVRQIFKATVHVVLCDRPNYRSSLAEIRQQQTGRREDTVEYGCKEFEDGDWLFMEADLVL